MGDYDFEFTLEPRCVKVGEPMTMRARVEPRGMFAMIATYADGSDHETRKAAWVGEDGAVVHTWNAPPAVGDGSITAQASTADTKRKGVKTLTFRVVGASQAC